MSLSLGMIIILLPLLLLAFLIAVGVVLYRHPSKLQKKWYQVSLKKRRRVKQAGIFLGFCAAAALFIYPLVNGEKFVSTIRLSAKERNLITKNKIKKNQYFDYEKYNLDEKCWQEGFITYDCKYEGNI